jgi:hypothetical protein
MRGKKAAALPYLSTEQSHSLDDAGIPQIARVDVTERRALREFEKGLPRSGIVADDENIA